MNRALDVTSSVLTSAVRKWRGTVASKKVQLPELRPVLFDREGDAECRLVREALTELNLDVDMFPMPEGGDRFLAKLKKLSGGDSVPFLYDPNTGDKHTGAKAIITYLFRHYRQQKPPAALKPNLINTLVSRLATEIRCGGGTRMLPSRQPKRSLTLFSFESSPFSRLVREKLSELQIPYTLVNLGKQQRSDMGPPNGRWTLKKYRPLPNTKRDDFFKIHGDVQVPYIVDPNTGKAMFESADIVNYLVNEYGQHDAPPSALTRGVLNDSDIIDCEARRQNAVSAFFIRLPAPCQYRL